MLQEPATGTVLVGSVGFGAVPFQPPYAQAQFEAVPGLIDGLEIPAKSKPLLNCAAKSSDMLELPEIIPSVAQRTALPA